MTLIDDEMAAILTQLYGAPVASCKYKPGDDAYLGETKIEVLSEGEVNIPLDVYEYRVKDVVDGREYIALESRMTRAPYAPWKPMTYASKCECGSTTLLGGDVAASMHSHWCPAYREDK